MAPGHADAPRSSCARSSPTARCVQIRPFRPEESLVQPHPSPLQNPYAADADEDRRSSAVGGLAWGAGVAAVVMAGRRAGE